MLVSVYVRTKSAFVHPVLLPPDGTVAFSLSWG